MRSRSAFETRRAAFAAFATLTGAAALAPPSRAFADDKAACADAYANAQTQRGEGKLVEARASAVACARDACPAFIRADCTAWLGEIEQAQPSVVFEVIAPSGEETGVARVFVDGKLVTDQLDGKPVAVDPGSRVFKFEIDGEPPVERAIIVKQGEKNRKVSASFVKPGAPAPVGPVAMNSSGPSALNAAPPDAATSAGPVPAWAWLAGGLGVATLGAGLVFGVRAVGASGRLHDECRPSFALCAPTLADGGVRDDVTSAKNTGIALAGVLGGVGLLAIGASLYGIASRPGARATATLQLRTVAGLSSGGAALHGRF